MHQGGEREEDKEKENTVWILAWDMIHEKFILLCDNAAEDTDVTSRRVLTTWISLSFLSAV